MEMDKKKLNSFEDLLKIIIRYKGTSETITYLYHLGFTPEEIADMMLTITE